MPVSKKKRMICALKNFSFSMGCLYAPLRKETKKVKEIIMYIFRYASKLMAKLYSEK